MSDEILLQFLEAGVVNVGSDDTKLDKLRTTVQDLCAVLKQTPDLAVRWTLVASDPEVSASDPVVTGAWAALKNNWVTVANTYQGVAVAITRALILDALVQTSKSEARIAVAFTNTARNMLPYMPLGSEGGVWLAAVENIEVLVDAQAEAEWTTPEAINIPPMNFEAPADITLKAGNKIVNRDTLQTKILAAAGPTGGAHNPHWPTQSPNPWATEFASRMSGAVADAIDAVAKENAIEPIDISPPLKKLASEVTTYVGDALKAFSGATAGLQRRTNLLWWKETLYSPTTKTSYRAMAPFTAASIMALDLFKQVPVFSPASVSAFLDEAIQVLPAASSAEASVVREITMALLTDRLTAPLREVAKQLVSSTEGRAPLLSILWQTTLGTLSSVQFRQTTGLGDEVRMRPEEWGAHLFRELQASRATHPGSPEWSRNRV